MAGREGALFKAYHASRRSNMWGGTRWTATGRQGRARQDSAGGTAETGRTCHSQTQTRSRSRRE